MKINHRGTGSAQYPPAMMLGLLIYSYATGTFSSRKIEKLTYENLAVRFLTGDTHPDHDSICNFRRKNKELHGKRLPPHSRLRRALPNPQGWRHHRRH